MSCRRTLGDAQLQLWGPKFSFLENIDFDRKEERAVDGGTEGDSISRVGGR